MATKLLKGSIGADGKVWCLPCAYKKVTSRFGMRLHPIYKINLMHYGVDLSGYTNMPIYAVRPGKIIIATYDESAGNYILLDHGDGTKSVYMHMGKAFGKYPNKIIEQEKNNYKWRVAVGDEVYQGQHIGDMGSTGGSTGTHLHFGIELNGSYVDPLLYIEGLECSVNADGSPIIDDELRVTNCEIPPIDNWKAINWDLGSNEGSPRMSLIKRNVSLNNPIIPLFSSYDKCDSYEIFGFNNELYSLNNDISMPNINEESFWEVAKNDCNYNRLGKIIKNNLSYCISRANQFIRNFKDKDFKIIIPKGTENWFEYNREKLKHNYGSLPRIGSIICWKPNNINNQYKVAIVESVLGTHCVKISEYDPSTDKVVENKIVNSSHNWGQGKDYIFEGFIHTLQDINVVNENSNISIKEDDNNLVVTVKNKTTSNKYCTILFAASNMKHVNNLEIKYQAFINNSNSEIKGNQFSICLSQQVWNCDQLGSLISDQQLNTKLKSNWPFTYFPYKEIELDSNQKEIPETDPKRYNAPYPAGNLTIDKITINNTEKDSSDIIKNYNLYEYIDGENIIDPFDCNGKFNRLLRNHPGYFCLTIKAPALKEEKNDEFTSTTIILKEILLHG